MFKYLYNDVNEKFIMIKILKENTGNLLKEFEHDNETFYFCDINKHEYKLILLRGSVI